MVWLLAVGVTSPCQPLTSDTWPSGPAAASAVLFPRFTTRYIRMPLAFDMSIGFTSENVATYSTLPAAFRGASRDVLDDPVAPVVRIELAERAAAQPFELADFGEGLALRNALIDDDARDAGFRGDRPGGSRRCREDRQGFRDGEVMPDRWH